MTNHPKRSRHANPAVTNVVVRRAHANVIDYTVTFSDELGSEDRAYHANRYATFHGEHTGKGNARQVMGPARTLWRETDKELRAAVKRAYPNATVTIR